MPDLASAIAKRFIEQRNVKSWQQPDGAWHIDRSPLTHEDVDEHLAGTRTLGHYVVGEGGTARVLAFDIDVVQGWRSAFSAEANPDRPMLIKQLNAMGLALARRTHTALDCHVAAAFSGNKGLHVYAFFPEGTPARELREAARVVLDSFKGPRFEQSRGNNFFKLTSKHSLLEVELFPKQDEVKGGSVGNLLRLPLGVHRKSGARGFFLSFTGDGTTFDEVDPLRALRGDWLPW